MTINDVLSAKELAQRWGMSIGTLANWRWQKKGPRWFKKGAVLYRIEDIRRYEKNHPELVAGMKRSSPRPRDH